MQVAPSVTYVHETWNCRTSPAEIALPELFPGRLLWGGMSPGTCKEWLLFQRVKLVVNCINRNLSDGTQNWLWLNSTRVRHEVKGEIAFMDFCVNWAGDRKQYLKTFAAICNILNRGGCVYIHCKSGKDRSAFTVLLYCSCITISKKMRLAQPWQLGSGAMVGV